MNFTPTAVFILCLLVMVVVSVFGGYFQFGVVGSGLETEPEPPDSIWDLATSSVSFFWGLLVFSIPDMPYIFSVVWWLLAILAVFSLIKIIWPGA